MLHEATHENVALMRSVLGLGPSDDALVCALRLANNDINLAINVLFDTIGYKGSDASVKRTTAGSGTRILTPCLQETMPFVRTLDASKDHEHGDFFKRGETHVNSVLLRKSNDVTGEQDNALVNTPRPNKNSVCSGAAAASPKQANLSSAFRAMQDSGKSASSMILNSAPAVLAENIATFVSQFDDIDEDYYDSNLSLQRWMLVGEASVLGHSTCKGSKIKPGEKVYLSFPKHSGTRSRMWNRGMGAIAAQQIVRFGTKKAGDIGRLSVDWARCLIPLASSAVLKVDAVCSSAPEVLTTLDNVILTLRICVSTAAFMKHRVDFSEMPSTMNDETTDPLLMLFLLGGKEPFMKAECAPDDLFIRKRNMGSKQDAVLPPEKRRKLVSSNDTDATDEVETLLSDSEIDHLVGTVDSLGLQEMESPSGLLCKLMAYQKQALHWMCKLEAGLSHDEASRTLHPCWAAFRLSDKKATTVYLNMFSGDATMNFPNALKLCRGGILADSMGLGKTVMTIALLLTHPGRGTGPEQQELQEKSAQKMGGGSSKSSRGHVKGGGTLIVCPMTLLGQWKTEIETHTKDGKLSVYSHYGAARNKNAQVLLHHDVVLTTYGVLSSDYQNGYACLHSIQWHRVVLDEAHTIKSSNSQSAQAVFKLSADYRWCLTATPIQNKLEDVFSLLHFLRIEPWCKWNWWYKLVQKPFEDSDERGLFLLRAILRPLMLRRTKDSTGTDGKPILVLPPIQSEVVLCEFSATERYFYDILYKKSKNKFMRLVEEGKVLNNYASILELLLRMRQCCDHPFLVLSRSDINEFTDIDKLARMFLDKGSNKSRKPISKTYVEGVVEDFRNGNITECPICLEVPDDAVFTPCAHCMCQECLLASWTSASAGLCPICRQHMTRQDITIAPIDTRFMVELERNWNESSKIMALMRELKPLREMGEKSIVFSQWTSFLNLLHIPLERQNFKYVRLDGTLSQVQRDKVIKDFSTNPKILVLLISLRAGGVGINLTAASNVFLLDPWWNPAVEEQAIMRIHRIGQTKKVNIKRFIMKDTVEEKMLQVQARKQRMIVGAMTDEEIKSTRIEELTMLFA